MTVIKVVPLPCGLVLTVSSVWRGEGGREGGRGEGGRGRERGREGGREGRGREGEGGKKGEREGRGSEEGRELIDVGVNARHFSIF